MAIFTQYGVPCTIVAVARWYADDTGPTGHYEEGMVVWDVAVQVDGDSTLVYPLSRLRADGGLVEVMDAIRELYPDRIPPRRERSR